VTLYLRTIGPFFSLSLLLIGATACHDDTRYIAAAADADAAMSDINPADDASVETATPDDLRVEDDAADVLATEDVPVADASCEYVCNIDCECLTDGRGCDIPACADSCTQIEQNIDVLLTDAQACSVREDCQLFEFPICGSAGCFQEAAGTGADLTSISNLAQQAQEAGCPGFTCGCGYESDPICLTGRCRKCPGDCDAPCEDLRAALVAETGPQRLCASDEECVAIDIPFCDIPELGCYGTVYSRSRGGRALEGLIDAFSARGCSNIDCDCAPPPGPPSCIDGVCGH
jgi:hypothetical protein